MSIAIAAFRGELLEAVLLVKRTTTPEGKVWSGSVHRAPTELAEPLRVLLRTLHWTGGGELEFIRDEAGVLWLIEWNPRFPAWINGATQAGHNLPGILLRAATGAPVECVAAVPRLRSKGFTRIVVEIAVREDLPLPPIPEDPPDQVRPAAKHPSGMPQLARRRRGVTAATPAEFLVGELREDLVGASSGDVTPRRCFLRRTAQGSFARVMQTAKSLDITVAYSIKTNPRPQLAALSLGCGFRAEAISPAEVAWALDQGWKPSDITFNGPVPLTEDSDAHPLGAAFADSLVAFATYAERRVARLVGMRLRPPGHHSRFGIDVGEPDVFRETAAAIGRLPTGALFGLSFHAASSDMGMARWEEHCHSLIEFGRALEDLSGRRLSLLDLGGGALLADFDLYFAALQKLASRARQVFPELQCFLIEPGKLLAESVEAVISRVLEVRVRATERDVVVDAGINDLPQVAVFPHRVVHLTDDRALLFGPGPNRILGRTCMEQDVLAQGVDLPADLAVGELLAFLDAGAYDASMAYEFATGRLRDAAAHSIT